MPDIAERIYKHIQTNPYCVDPFNEAGITERERETLLVRDFLESYKALSAAISEKVNEL